MPTLGEIPLRGTLEPMERGMGILLGARMRWASHADTEVAGACRPIRRALR